MQSNTQARTKKLAILAMLSALAFVLMFFIRIPVILWLKYEPKDVIIAIGGFLYGPLASLAMSVLVSFAEMLSPVSETGILGCLMNIISTVTFVCTAAFIYKKMHTLTGAAAGLVVGVLVSTAVMLLWNYLLVPIYAPNTSREVVVGMLAPIFLPFNLIKGGLNAAITMLVYKPVRLALDKAGLLPLPVYEDKKSAKFNAGVLLVSAFVIATCVLFILSLQGII